MSELNAKVDIGSKHSQLKHVDNSNTAGFKEDSLQVDNINKDNNNLTKDKDLTVENKINKEGKKN